MEYFPQLHRTALSASVGSSGSRGEGSFHHHPEINLDSSVDGSTIYVLSSPPSVSHNPTGPHLNILSVRISPSKGPDLTPREESVRNRTSAIPERSIDRMYGWECVRSPPPPQRFASTNECDLEEWDCTASDSDMVLDERVSALDEEISSASRWDLVPEHDQSPDAPRLTHFLRMHGRPLESRKLPVAERTRAHAFTRSRAVPPPPTTHARIRLPLLSFFVALLSVDDTTLHLVTHASAHSALFPGPLCPSDEGGGGIRDSHETHEVSMGLEPSSSSALRDGLAVACDESILPSNPFGLSMSPFAGLLDLVRDVCAGGRAALREVW
jgi:hypothetical protein